MSDGIPKDDGMFPHKDPEMVKPGHMLETIRLWLAKDSGSQRFNLKNKTYTDWLNKLSKEVENFPAS
jgi:hypothetical protein